MKLLFDYNPIIEIDIKNPYNQIVDLLKNFDKYIPLIEKNYKEISLKHSWSKRWSEIEKILSNT